MVRIRDVTSTFIPADPEVVAAATRRLTETGEAPAEDAGGATIRVRDRAGSLYLIQRAPGGSRVVHSRTVEGIRSLRLRLAPEELRGELEADLDRIKRLVVETSHHDDA